MGCFSSPQPVPVNYGTQTADTLKAQVSLAPQQYANEAQYQPLYQNLALSNLNTLLNGTAGGTQSVTDNLTADKKGWYSADGRFLQGPIAAGSSGGPGATWRQVGESYTNTHDVTTAPQQGVFSMLQQQNSNQRTADINDVATLGPQARAAMLAANPDQATLLAKLNSDANIGLDAGTGLTAAEQQQTQQASRAAFAARGMGGGNASVSDELLKQFQLGNQLQQQRQQFAQSVMGSNASVVGDPFQQILGRTSGAIQTAQGIGQQAGPSLFNPESALSASITSGNTQAQQFHDNNYLRNSGVGQAISTY